MQLSFCAIAVGTITLIVSSTLAPAAEVRVLSVGSTQIAAKAIATESERARTGARRPRRRHQPRQYRRRARGAVEPAGLADHASP